jgi:hypothetical protein
MKDTASPADLRWGYRFGVEGVVPIKEAARLMACSTRTVERRVQAGLLRRGYRMPGVPTSGAVICRRSLNDHLSQMEV